MSVVKVIELISEGNSIEAAMNAAVAEASKTIHNIRQVNIKHIEGRVENGKIAGFRVNCNISFVVDNNRS